MRVSRRGLIAIEGREGIRLKAYRDSKGLPTIGVGHLIVPGDGFSMSSRITQEQCDELFAKDVKKYEDAVNSLNVKLSQNQFDALVSFCLNIGTGGFKGSTVAKRLKVGDYNGAAKAMMSWVKPPEITGRRKSEQKQFLTPYPNSAAAGKTDGDTSITEKRTNTANGAATDGPAAAAADIQPNPPQAEGQTIVDVPPVATEHPEGLVSKFKTWYAAAPAFLLSILGSLWSWLQGAATEIIVAFLAAAGVVVIVFIITNFLQRRGDKQRDFEAKEKQKDRDFELTKLQLLSAMDPNKQTVRVSPPVVVVPDVTGEA